MDLFTIEDKFCVSGLNETSPAVVRASPSDSNPLS